MVELTEAKIKNMKRNIKIYPIYKTISWDLLFYYAIIYSFLANQKALTAGQILLFQAFFIFFRLITQFICSNLVRKNGKSAALVLGNLFSLVSTTTIIIAPNYPILILSQLFSAFSYNLKEICETDLLYDSLVWNDERSKVFVNVDGKAFSKFFYLDAITSILAGFLYVKNPYLPLAISCIFSTIATIISFKFEDEIFNKENVKEIKVKDHIEEGKVTYKAILKSKRLRYLLILDSLFWALTYTIAMLKGNVLINVGIKENYIGIVFALCILITAIASKFSQKIHEKNRNRTLELLMLLMVIPFILIGILVFAGVDKSIIQPIVVTLFIIQFMPKGPYMVLIKKYLQNFTDSYKRLKIARVKITMDNLVSSIVLFAESFMMLHMQDKYSIVIIATAFLLLVVYVLLRMRKFVGKKYEEYEEGEII